jgi:hypothetical protein
MSSIVTSSLGYFISPIYTSERKEFMIMAFPTGGTTNVGSTSCAGFSILAISHTGVKIPTGSSSC